MNYGYYYRKELSLKEKLTEWDLFISAYNQSDRLSKVYDLITAKEKVWLDLPEYKLEDSELPKNKTIVKVPSGTEISQLQHIIKSVNLSRYKDGGLCVDITGFMRPQLLVLLLFFKVQGFRKVDFLYSEPDTYSKRENTEFAYGSVSETRQVLGYSGVNKSIDGRDLLIIAAGYDSSLIGKVAQYKENSEIVPLFGFPSLRPDMYQENILRAVGSESFESGKIKDPVFAPAADPFETAEVIKNYISSNGCLEKYKHIYISPLSTKAQVLGVGLVYLNEYYNKQVSLIYPFCESYAKETSRGLVKMWQYTVEFS